MGGGVERQRQPTLRCLPTAAAPTVSCPPPPTPSRHIRYAALRSFLAQNAWPPWPADGANAASCGCGLVSREVLTPGYVWYRAMQWGLRAWLGHEAGSAPLSSTGFRLGSGSGLGLGLG